MLIRNERISIGNKRMLIRNERTLIRSTLTINEIGRMLIGDKRTLIRNKRTPIGSERTTIGSERILIRSTLKQKNRVLKTLKRNSGLVSLFRKPCFFFGRKLKHSLGNYSFGNFHETGYISSFHVIYITIGFGAIFHTRFVNVEHNFFEFFINFFFRPVQFD